MYYIYIMTNKKNGTLYIGATSDLPKRAYEHKNDLVDGFTKTYGLHKLVYYEQAEEPDAAVQRERRLKKWNRQWKIELIEQFNPEWEDLYESIIG
jgi:putative endonuclease